MNLFNLRIAVTVGNLLGILQCFKTFLGETIVIHTYHPPLYGTASQCPDRPGHCCVFFV
jgi:hypothetical protein